MVIRIVVKPSQRADQLWRVENGLLAHIRALPQHGEANRYLQRFLADIFGVARTHVTITKGLASSHKTVLLEAPDHAIESVLAGTPEAPQRRLFE